MAKKKGFYNYNIMQYEKHPETGDELLTEEKIKSVVAKYKSIDRWAYIIHDKDVYTEANEEANPDHKAGTKKPKHFHIALKMKDNCIELDTVAKWFGILPNYVEIPKGRGAFLDCVQYMTHERTEQQEQGKFRYADLEIQANFDWRAELDKRDEMKAKWGKGELSDRQVMGQRIMLEGLTLRQVKAEDPLLYADNLEFFRKMRGVYLSDLEPPKTRINYYLCGDAGAGKGVMSKAVARALFPELINDEEIFFEVGADNALFEGYDGQPVLIWHDRRAGNLIKELGGRSNVYNVFDTHPSKQRQNIKFSSVGLINRVNIVNSVQPYVEFLETLAGAKDDNDSTNDGAEKSQAYRRFPLIINIHPEEIDIYINKGFISQHETYLEYEEHKGFYANMRKVAETCSKYETLRREIEGMVVKPVVEQHHRAFDAIGQNNEGEVSLSKALCESGLMLDERKTKEQLDAQRKRHERAASLRKWIEENPLIYAMGIIPYEGPSPFEE